MDDAVTNEMLKGILSPERATAEALLTQPDYHYIHKELARPGVNLTLLWTEYCRCCESNGTTLYIYTILRKVPAVVAVFQSEQIQGDAAALEFLVDIGVVWHFTDELRGTSREQALGELLVRHSLR